MNPTELRPTEILQAYWDSLIVIEERALFLDPVYFTYQEAKS